MFRAWARGALFALLALGAFYAGVGALAVPVLLMLPPDWLHGPWGFAVAAVPLAAGALAVSAFMVRRGWSRWRTLGWPGLGAAPAELAHGIVVGGLMAAGAILLAVVAGGARVELTGESLGAYAEAASRVAAVLLMAALAEELLFRGYPLARLSRTFGKVGASGVLAVGFALVHLGNPGVSVAGLLNIALAALVLSAAFFTRGGLMAAWGVHFGWNGGLSLGADAPVSGVGFALPLVEFTASGPEWVAGGAFGPEGGVAATVPMAAGLLWFVRRARGEAG